MSGPMVASTWRNAEVVSDLLVPRGEVDVERAERERALVRDHLNVVWRFLRRLGFSPADADDATQEIFVIAVAKMADGSVFMDKKEVKVTIGGCGG